MKHCFFPAIALLALGLASGVGAVEPSHPINDTGVRFCGSHPSGNTVPTCVLPTNPVGQDRQYGRDAAATLPAAGFSKTGASADNSAGFDFTKIANNGTVLAAGIALGSGATDWACTRDNVTGLTWEVKTSGGAHPRHMDNTYAWATAGTYVTAVNGTSLCGYTDWRLPTLQELAGLIDYGRSAAPTIDSSYFINTANAWYWSSTASATGHWTAYFDLPAGTIPTNTQSQGDGTALRVRLVRP